MHAYNRPFVTLSFKHTTGFLDFKSFNALDTCDDVNLVSLVMVDGNLYVSLPIALMVFFRACETSM